MLIAGTCWSLIMNVRVESVTVLWLWFTESSVKAWVLRKKLIISKKKKFPGC